MFLVELGVSFSFVIEYFLFFLYCISKTWLCTGCIKKLVPIRNLADFSKTVDDYHKILYNSYPVICMQCAEFGADLSSQLAD